MSILGRDTLGGRRVERREQPVDAPCAESSDLGVEPCAQRLIPSGGRDDPLEESAQIHSGASDHDRHAPAREDRRDRGVGVPNVLGEGVIPARVGDVQQPVRDTLSILGRRLRGRRVEATVNLEGIAADHLALEPFGDPRRELRFPGARRAANDQNRRPYLEGERTGLGRGGGALRDSSLVAFTVSLR